MLTVLAGTESSLSLAQIATLAPQGSRQGLALVVDRLVEHGLVTATPANRGYMYALNREHVLAEAVMIACAARQEILTRLESQMHELDPQPFHVSIFGSFARLEAGPLSDIDVLLVLADDDEVDEAWYAQVHGVGDRVSTWTGNRMEYLAHTVSELRALARRGEPIVVSWLADSITVLGPSIETLIRDASVRPGRK